MRAKQRGVNLIELMVVIGILSIIAAIAFPAFTSQVLKSNRMDAKRMLMQIQSAYERYYNENSNAYPTLASITAVYTALSLGTPPASSFYTFTAPTTTTTSYTLSASVTGNQVADTTCTNFYLDYLGGQTSTNNAAASTSCW